MNNKWYTKSKPDDLQGVILDETTGANIAVSYDVKDAALIAAAPDMLQVLERIYSSAAESAEWIRERIAPVIAQARGEA